MTQNVAHSNNSFFSLNHFTSMELVCEWYICCRFFALQCNNHSKFNGRWNSEKTHIWRGREREKLISKHKISMIARLKNKDVCIFVVFHLVVAVVTAAAIHCLPIWRSHIWFERIGVRQRILFSIYGSGAFCSRIFAKQKRNLSFILVAHNSAAWISTLFCINGALW